MVYHTLHTILCENPTKQPNELHLLSIAYVYVCMYGLEIKIQQNNHEKQRYDSETVLSKCIYTQMKVGRLNGTTDRKKTKKKEQDRKWICELSSCHI